MVLSYGFHDLLALESWFDSMESRLDGRIWCLMPRPLVVDLGSLGVLLGAIFVTLGTWFEPLLARGVYRDSFESSRLGFGLVNQPECDFYYVCFLVVNLV